MYRTQLCRSLCLLVLQVGQAAGGVTGAFVALAVLPECCTR